MGKSRRPTDAPDPQPGDFDAELESISDADLEFVEAGSGLAIAGARQLAENPPMTPEQPRVTEILDAIPGAWERAQEGLAQAGRGEGVPLDELT